MNKSSRLYSKCKKLFFKRLCKSVQTFETFQSSLDADPTLNNKIKLLGKSGQSFDTYVKCSAPFDALLKVLLNFHGLADKLEKKQLSDELFGICLIVLEI